MLPDKLKENPAAAALDARVADAITGGHAEHGEATLFILPSRIVEVCRFLKDEQKFVRLSGITAVDWHPADPRFEVVYLLHSLEKNLRLRLNSWILKPQSHTHSVPTLCRSPNRSTPEAF